MTLDDQLREFARVADEHQQVLTVDEIVRRATGHRTGFPPMPSSSNGEVLDRMTGPFLGDEATVVDVGSSSDTDQPVRRWRPLALAGLAAAAAVIAVTVVVVRDDNPPSPADKPPVTEQPATTATPPTVTVDPSPTSSAPDPTAASLATPPPWSSMVRAPSDLVHDMTPGTHPGMPIFENWTGLDALDAAEGWADVQSVFVEMQRLDLASPLDRPTHGQPRWEIALAGKPPLPADPGLLIAYGLVLDTNRDGVADYSMGIDNDAPVQGDHHVWLTDLATGETDERVGATFDGGWPVSVGHPDDQSTGENPTKVTFAFGFTKDTPADLDPDTVRFYAWASATRGGEVVTTDYAPDTGWAAGVVTLKTPESVQQIILDQIAHDEATAGFVAQPAHILTVTYLAPGAPNILGDPEGFARWQVEFEGTWIACGSYCSVHAGGTKILADDEMVGGETWLPGPALCHLSGESKNVPVDQPDCTDLRTEAPPPTA